MKTTLIVSAFFFLAILAHAQTRFVGGGTAPGQFNFTGIGGSTGFGTSDFRSSSFGMSFLPVPATSPASKHYTYIYARGSEATYVPTRFVSFATALKMAQAELAYHPKSLAEVAAEYRELKRRSVNRSGQAP